MVLIDNIDLVLQGFGNTLLLVGMTVLIGLPLGIVIAVMRVSPVAVLRVIASVYTELVRNTPLYVVFVFFTTVIGVAFFRLDFYPAAISALTVYTSAFFAEAIRSGFNSVPIGQVEAARSIGLTFGQTISTVVVPQAFRSVIPPLINVIIALVKNSSIAGAFFIVELFNIGRRLANQNPGEVIAVFVGIAFCYLLMTVPLGRLADALEKKYAVQR